MALRLVRVHLDEETKGIQYQWGSIFSGTFIMLGFAAFFLLLGNAIGLNPGNMVRAGASGPLRFWSWIYVAVTMIVSYFMGGYVGTRSANVITPGSGAVHALTSWGLATTLGVLVGITGSVAFRDMIAGFGPNVINWLAICIVGLGLPAAVIGGMMGKEFALHHAVSEHERREGEMRPAA